LVVLEHQRLSAAENDFLDLPVLAQIMDRRLPVLLLKRELRRLLLKRPQGFITELAIPVADIREAYDDAIIILVLSDGRDHLLQHFPIFRLAVIRIGSALIIQVRDELSPDGVVRCGASPFSVYRIMLRI
jgi:hypothetical protein